MRSRVATKHRTSDEGDIKKKELRSEYDATCGQTGTHTVERAASLLVLSGPLVLL